MPDTPPDRGRTELWNGILRGVDGKCRQPKAPSTDTSNWAERLRRIDAAERAALAELDANPPRHKSLAKSLVALETIAKRARVACEEYPLAAVAGRLADAPEPRLRSDGSRFDHDRLMRVVATLDVVPRKKPPSGETVGVVFFGDTILPAFAVTNVGYDYGPLMGADKDSFAVGLFAAQQRFERIYIDGNAAFVDVALTTAAQLGIPVANAELQPQWQHLEAQCRRANAVRAAAISRHRTALESTYERTVFSVFGRPVEELDLQYLTASEVRATAEVSLRAIIPIADTDYAIFEAFGGRLQALKLTPELHERIAAALLSPPWDNTLAVSTGGGRPIAIECSPDREATRAERTSQRKSIGRIFLEPPASAWNTATTQS